MTGTKVLAMLAATALATAGCGSSGEQPSSGPVTVTYWHGYNETGEELQTLRDVVIPAFEKAHPNIKVKQVPFPDEALRQKVLGAAAGGELPCLLRSDIVWVPELAKLGVLEQLDTRLKDFDALAKRTFPGPLESNKYRDKYYGLPLDTNTRVLMYTPAALKAAGLEKAPETFEDVRAAAAKLKGSPVKAFADGGTDGWNLLPWIWSAGGDLLNPELTKASGYLDSPESVAAVQLLVDLRNEGQLPDIMLGGTGGTPTDEGIAKGEYLSTLDGPWTFPIYEKQFPGVTVATSKMPAGPGGSVSVVGGEDIVMTKSCPDKEAGGEFIRYLLSDEAQLEMAKVGQMPVLADLGARLTSIKPYYGIFVEQLKTARPRPPVPQYKKIESLLSQHVAEALKGTVSPQQALTDAARAIDAVLAQD